MTDVATRMPLSNIRVRPFRYRYRIPVSITVTVSGTVRVLNGTRYLQYPKPISTYRISVSGCRYRVPIPTSANGQNVGCRYRISIFDIDIQGKEHHTQLHKAGKSSDKRCTREPRCTEASLAVVVNSTGQPPRSSFLPGCRKAWMDEVFSRSRVLSRNGFPVRLPIAHMVCNQTPPMGDKPSLMTFREVISPRHSTMAALPSSSFSCT